MTTYSKVFSVMQPGVSGVELRYHITGSSEAMVDEVRESLLRVFSTDAGAFLKQPSLNGSSDFYLVLDQSETKVVHNDIFIKNDDFAGSGVAFINRIGEVQYVTGDRLLAHEMFHAVEGVKDPGADFTAISQYDAFNQDPDADVLGQAVTFANAVMEQIENSDQYGRTHYQVQPNSPPDFRSYLDSENIHSYLQDDDRIFQTKFGAVLDAARSDVLRTDSDVDHSDLLIGYGGDDTLISGGGRDFLFGGADNDLLIGGAGKDVLVGGEDEDILIAGDMAQDVNGQVPITHASLAAAVDLDNDQLFGGEGADQIVSTGGRDLLVGGAGNDKFFAYTQSYTYNEMEQLQATNGSELGTLIWGGEGADEYHFFTSIGGGVDEFKTPKIAVIQIEGLTGSEWPNVDLDKLHDGIRDYLTFGSGVEYTHILINPDETDTLFIDGVKVEGGNIAPSDVENEGRIEIDDYVRWGYYDEDNNFITTSITVKDSSSVITEYDVNTAYLGAGNRFWVAGYDTVGDSEFPIRRFGGAETAYGPNGEEFNYNIFNAYDVLSDKESFSIAGFTNGMFGINFVANPLQTKEYTTYTYSQFSLSEAEFYALRNGSLGYGVDLLSKLPEGTQITGTDIDEDEQHLLGDGYFDATTFTFNIEDFLIDDEEPGEPDPDTVDPIVVAGTDSSEDIEGGAGHDDLDGGGGDDQIDGKAGNDTIQGGEGDDTLSGGTGADTMFGGDGNDTVYADADDTWFSGDAGIDTLIYQGTDDRQYAMDQGAFENMEAGAGNNTVWGTAANNVINGQAGNDVIHGYGGDDTLIGGAGADSLLGGDGNDTVYADADDAWFSGDAGIDTLIYQGTDDRQYAMDQGAFENMEAGAGNNTVWGTAANNLINGQAGNDVIHGYGGDDTLIGGAGADSLLGGDGNDTVYADADDTWFSGDAGIDTLIYTGADNRQYSLAQGAFENAHMGSGNNVVWGTDAANIIDGQAGNDTLFGYGGSDRIIGGAGSDYLVGGAGNDTFVFALGDTGHDTVVDFGTGDVIEFASSLFGTFADVLASTSDDGVNTYITIDADTSIRLDNILVGQLQMDDFHFV